jgi:hypothetical protein
MVFEDPETHDEVVGVVVVKGGCVLEVDVYLSIAPRFGTFGPEWWLVACWPGLLAFFFLCASYRKQGVQEVRCQVGCLYHHFSCFMLTGVGYAVPSEKRYLPRLYSSTQFTSQCSGACRRQNPAFPAVSFGLPRAPEEVLLSASLWL